ncbi:bucentaur or craniofacial development-domain-containing protein [Ephemerocybe angulata]|uniref:SWR1-complex protein 5 n=1 Tax=Ephemerocybe angulata TaxID=980116 RepID=A0A8H6I4L2_9AGAR|nr:bucentaur or craniofacial development-domain-containing protein [Tulosesus angulatus]
MKRPPEDDSEDDDEDYVPPKEENGSSSETEDESGTQGTIQEVETKAEKKDLSKVWQDFQATVAGTSAKPIQRGDSGHGGERTKVKVVKKFRFAGQEHEEVVEVFENSEDAKRWLRYQEPSTSTSLNPPDHQKPSTSTPTPAPLPPKRKPGPRKPKTTLAPLPSKSAPLKKLTTLEKSALDWAKHTSQPSSSDGVTPTAEELEAHRRGGGGYLDKVEFLNRVEERKESMLSSQGSGAKRIRRG